MSTFQIILLSIFGVFILVAVTIFAVSRGPSGGGPSVAVSVWGTVSAADFNAIQPIIKKKDEALTVNYREFREDTFDTELVEALASGTGPDLVLFTDSSIFRHLNKIAPISFDVVSERDFRDAFVEEAELFRTEGGYIALPFAIDPLLMYWNRALFTDAGLATPPRTWEEFLLLPERLTKRDKAGNIAQSAAALGEFRNIENAKAILATLFLQAGSSVTGVSEGRIVASLGDETVSSLSFYSEFTNPVKPLYSWSRSLPEARFQFLGGNLAVYFGFASELYPLRERNPNLNFDVTSVPEPETGGRRGAYGKMFGLSIMRQTRDQGAALRAALLLTGKDVSEAFAGAATLPPPRRDLLAKRQTDAYGSVFYEAALRARGWRDPNDTETSHIFQKMVEDVTSGRARPSEAVRKAAEEINSL